MRSTALLACALLALLVAPPAQAASDCYLRLAHLSPDTPPVDVTVTSFARPDWSVTIKGVAYGALSGYQRIESGTYTVAMRPAGADPASAPVISATLDGETGRAYTVAGLGKYANLALDVLADDITLPPANQARVRVVNAAPLAGGLTVKRDGAPLVEKAAFGVAGDYRLVAAGRTVLRLTSTQGALTDLPVTLEAGSVYSVLVLEHDGVLSAEARQDAKGAAVVPTGGIETGYGGAAWTWSPALLALAAAAGGALVLALRRRPA
ncbi:DUF4397 domain-containing protein [Actinosynnema sp. NPDC020468]|uniref:DUF4397 domain-containing protein n=1 Tax=Actinosynnema sp. NPDC020468 TaxID=3154488 RepID=UPI0034116D05